MGDREEKWNKMKEEYKDVHMSERQVAQMKEKIEQAKNENRQEGKQPGKKHHTGRNLAAAAVAAVAVLAILPNTSADVAYAMSRVPGLSIWVKVVTFRDYQYEDERNVADITVPELDLQVEDAGEADDLSGTVNSETGNSASENSAAGNIKAQEKAKKTTEEINAEIQTISDKLIAEFKENLENEEGYQSMMVKSEVISTTDRYFALKLICYQGAGSGAEWNYYYTIDLETGERLELADLFKEGSDYVTIISENIKEQMKEQMAADEMVTYWVDSEMPEWDFKEITEETGFYLNNNGELVICFNEGDVGPMSMGCVEFVIPKEILKDILAVSF